MPRTVERIENMAQLLEQLGGVPLRRIRVSPPVGKATEKDLLYLLDHHNLICELVDGVLVEKDMGAKESALAFRLGKYLSIFVDTNDSGMLLGADGTLRLWPKLVRVPDVSFISWDRLPAREYPEEPIPDLYPDLAVEVISAGNTKGEMDRKLKEYFLAGTRLVWYVYPDSRSVEVFTTPDESVTLTEKDTLDGGEVLPGFRLPLKELFARLPRPRKNGSSRRKSS